MVDSPRMIRCYTYEEAMVVDYGKEKLEMKEVFKLDEDCESFFTVYLLSDLV